jgi:hypothetical protein
MRLGSTAAAPFLGTQFVSLYQGDERVPTVPGQPVITSAFFTGSSSFVAFTDPANDGGETITDYQVFVDGTIQTPDSIVAGEAAFNGQDLSGSVVRVSAVNAVGAGPLSEPSTVAGI